MQAFSQKKICTPEPVLVGSDCLRPSQPALNPATTEIADCAAERETETGQRDRTRFGNSRVGHERQLIHEIGARPAHAKAGRGWIKPGGKKCSRTGKGHSTALSMSAGETLEIERVIVPPRCEGPERQNRGGQDCACAI